MIKVERKPAVKPGSLEKPYGNRVRPPKIKGLSERDAVIKRFNEHRRKAGTDMVELVKFKFPYERYSDSEVIEALRGLFHGKCAYCESRYAGTQPMDVEHWRPKGQVKENVNAGAPELGYYWLASEWKNLLPSCIDCNRARSQFDVLENDTVLLGKKNQFPVEGKRTINHEDDPNFDGGPENVLLINPCDDDPESLLRYDEQGVILPKSDDPSDLDHKRAMASIRVYALNRAELVAERLAVIRLVDHRLLILEKLADMRESLQKKNMVREEQVIADIIASEFDFLLDMTLPEQPYSGLARQLLREVAPVSP